MAHLVAPHDPAVAGHPWLERATDYCIARAEALDEAPFAIELAATVRCLDAAHHSRPETASLIERLGRFIPDDGRVPVTGGSEGETMRALDFAPRADGPARSLFTPDVIDAELQVLADEQQDDGGWKVDFRSYSPAAELEWRGYMTVHAIALLRGR
jgi:hypothetical protein